MEIEFAKQLKIFQNDSNERIEIMKQNALKWHQQSEKIKYQIL